MAEKRQVQFEDLPSHLLEYIFYYVPLIEIVKLSAVSPILFTIGDIVIRKKFFELRFGIYKELKVLKEDLNELPKSAEFFQERIVLLRSYYFLEMLLSELSLIRAVWRQVLYDKVSSVIPIGKLLHEFYSAFYNTKRRQLPPWHINDETEGKVIKYAKLFFDCKLSEVQYDEFFGCQILDVLDSMINRQFRIDAKYYPEKNLCSIDAVYKLRDPHYLNRTPKINENGITQEDRKRILTYFVSLVRINNRVALREEQYHRELEISRSREINLLALEVDLLLSRNSSWLTKDVRTYESVFSNPQREERKVNEIYEFEETYRSTEFSHSAGMEKKFICNVQINCPLKKAPLSILDCWSRLKNDLISQIYVKPNLSFLEDSISVSDTSRGSDIIDILGDCRMQCIVEVVISNNNNYEIDRLVISEPVSSVGN